MTTEAAPATPPATTSRRPGPFGPAFALLPEGGRLETISASEPVAQAIETLLDLNVSQLLVFDEDDVVIGVFTWKSLGTWLADNHGLRLDLNALPVRNTDPEEPAFISRDTYIDTAMDWSKTDYTIVGSAKEPLGVLTTTDVLGRLNDFAEAFVLLYEIEHEIRDIIRMVYTPDQLSEVLGELSESADRPEVSAEQLLLGLLEGEEVKALSKPTLKALEACRGLMAKSIRRSKSARPVDGLEDLTFAQYRTIIFSKRNAKVFETAFGERHFGMLENEFARVNDLRNVVFHFRRGITARDTDRLRRFLQKRREDRVMLEQHHGGRNTTAATRDRRPPQPR